MSADKLEQMFLDNFIETQSETITVSSHASIKQKSGDLGEFEFDLECARLNLAPFGPKLSNGPIDRLLYLPSGLIKKIHVKSAVLTNVSEPNNRRNGTKYKNYFYTFTTRNSIQVADFYFCCGLNQDYKKTANWWVPWSIRASITIPASGHGFEEYLRNPFGSEISRNGDAL